MYQKIKDFLNENSDAMVRDLIRLCRIPSVKGDAEEGAPYGRECRLVLEECERLFFENGFATEPHEKYLLAFGGNADAEKTVVTCAHADVVPAGGGWTMCEPFSPEIKDGFIFGRGVHDNKNAVIFALYAAKAIRELDLPFDAKLIMFVGADEENGMSDVRAFLTDHPMPDIGIVPDSGFPVKRGETSLMQWYAECDSTLADVIAIDGADVFNRTAGDVKVKLRFSDALFAEINERITENTEVSREDDTIILHAKGISKHAASPDGSVNAVELAAKLLCDCPSFADRSVLADAVTLIGGGCGIYDEEWQGDGQFEKPTGANGIAKAENGKLRLGFDSRFLKKVPHETLAKIAKNKAESLGWSYRFHKLSEGFYLPEDDPLVTAMLEEYERYTGKEGKSFMGAGGTYSRAFTHSVSVGTTLGGNYPGLPKGHGAIHQPDECMELEGMKNAAELYMRMLIRCAEV